MIWEWRRITTSLQGQNRREKRRKERKMKNRKRADSLGFIFSNILGYVWNLESIRERKKILREMTFPCLVLL